MTSEQLIGRVISLEWLLTTLVADGISQSPMPAAAAVKFQAVTVGWCRDLLDPAQMQGDTPDGPESRQVSAPGAEPHRPGAVKPARANQAACGRVQCFMP